VGGDLVILMLDLSVEAADFGQKMNYPESSTSHPDYNHPVIRHIDDYERIHRIELPLNKDQHDTYPNLPRIPSISY
jgi:hypothetical protein